MGVRTMALLLLLATPGCRDIEARVFPPDAPDGGLPGHVIDGCRGARRWVLLLDLSGSIGDAQRSAWAELVRTEIASRVQACDDVLVLGVHEASGSAAPLLARSVPPPQQSLRQRVAALRALATLRSELVATATAASYGQGGASHTRLFDALDRVPPADGPTVIVVLSDMEDSGLPRPASLLEGADAAASRIRDEQGWSADRFRGATVVAVLPSQRGTSKGVHSRRALRAFWDALCARTGARLASFETYVPAGTL